MQRFAIQNLLKPNAQGHFGFLKLRSIYRTVYIADTCEC